MSRYNRDAELSKITAAARQQAPSHFVAEVLLRTDYDPRKIHFALGKVKDIHLPEAPIGVALRRLDTN